MASLLKKVLFSWCACMLLLGCQASAPLPKSQKLSAEKVAEIASTIDRKYPQLSREIRGKLLNTVVQSLDNMVFVEGGEFQMGDFGWVYDDDVTNMCAWPCGVDPRSMGRLSMYGNDDFVHLVKLSSYHLSKYQVMLQDFDLFFVARGEPLFDAEKRKRKDLQFRYQPTLPAPTKSWQEAKDYCGWLGELSGYPVDLPTEAQWEYAARSRGRYIAFGTDNGSLNYGRNFPYANEIHTYAVDRFFPNQLGIYNISGNATDWVNDWYGKDYYRQSPVDNPLGPENGTQKMRRGAPVGEGRPGVSVVSRYPDDPIKSGYYPGTGMRCAIQSEKPL